MSEQVTLDDGTIIDKVTEPNGYAYLWIADGEQYKPFVHLYVARGHAMVSIDESRRLVPEVLAAIGETFTQWAERAQDDGMSWL